jgi:hypothetical protein
MPNLQRNQNRNIGIMEEWNIGEGIQKTGDRSQQGNPEPRTLKLFCLSPTFGPLEQGLPTIPSFAFSILPLFRFLTSFGGFP